MDFSNFLTREVARWQVGYDVLHRHQRGGGHNDLRDFSATGVTCLRRAQLEVERRFCDNTTEIVSGADMVLSDVDGMSMLLDLRTCHKPG